MRHRSNGNGRTRMDELFLLPTDGHNGSEIDNYEIEGPDSNVENLSIADLLALIQGLNRKISGVETELNQLKDRLKVAIRILAIKEGGFR